MKLLSLLCFLAACLVLAVLAAHFAPSLHQLTNAMRKNTRIHAYNALGDGTHPAGKLSLLTDAAITTRHLLGKRGSDASHVAVISSASDEPLGVIFDEAAAAESLVGVQLLGCAPETVLMVAQGTIDADADVYSHSNGKVTTAPTSAGTYWKVGKARSASTAGLLIEVEPITPQKVVVVANGSTLSQTQAAMTGGAIVIVLGA
jgi:hypothetical protein